MVLFLTACTNRERIPPKVPGLDAAALSYVRLAVALGERDTDSIDFYAGPQNRVADVRNNPPSFSEIAHQANMLSGTLRAIPTHGSVDDQRKSYLFDQLTALSCRAAFLSGQHLSFDQETNCFFKTQVPDHIDEEQISSIKKQIDHLVPGPGSLTSRYAKLAKQFVIPNEKLKAVMAGAIQACRTQTSAHVTLPANEKITVAYVGDRPWAGYSLYKGNNTSEITFNTDFPITVDRALDLACHETYPGHHTFNMLRDRQLASTRVEYTVQPTYSPQSFLSEGAATIASQIAFSPEQRLRVERDTLLPLAGLSPKGLERYLQLESLIDQLHPAIPLIARRYLDGDLEFVRAGQMLEDQSLMGESFETLKYLNRFRSYVVTYTWSPDLLQKQLPSRGSARTEQERWNTFLRWVQDDPTVQIH